MKKLSREDLSEYNEEMLFADGFDDALIGVCFKFGNVGCAAYNLERCYQILMEKNDEMTYEDAVEYMDYNVLGAYVGEHTPVFILIPEMDE